MYTHTLKDMVIIQTMQNAVTAVPDLNEHC